MVEASSLLAPAGEIEVEFFPEEDEDQVLTRLEAYLSEGDSKAAALTDLDAKDEAVTVWAYHRAYRAIYTRLLAAPSSYTNADQGSASYAVQQIKMFGDLASQKFTEFTDILATLDASIASPPPLASTSTVNAFSW